MVTEFIKNLPVTPDPIRIKMTTLKNGNFRNSQKLSAKRYFNASSRMQDELELKRLSMDSRNSRRSSLSHQLKRIKARSPKALIPKSDILFKSKKVKFDNFSGKRKKASMRDMMKPMKRASPRDQDILF